jgi:hypothetical protein
VLVARVFLGPRPAGKQVCHEDGQKGNCRFSNLRYDTPTGNAADRWRHGTMLHGERVSSARLSAADVDQIRRLKGTGSWRSIARRFGVTHKTIGNIHRGVTWTRTGVDA